MRSGQGSETETSDSIQSRIRIQDRRWITELLTRRSLCIRPSVFKISEDLRTLLFRGLLSAANPPLYSHLFVELALRPCSKSQWCPLLGCARQSSNHHERREFGIGFRVQKPVPSTVWDKHYAVGTLCRTQPSAHLRSRGPRAVLFSCSFFQQHDTICRDDSQTFLERLFVLGRVVHSFLAVLSLDACLRPLDYRCAGWAK